MFTELVKPTCSSPKILVREKKYRRHCVGVYDLMFIYRVYGSSSFRPSYLKHAARKQWDRERLAENRQKYESISPVVAIYRTMIPLNVYSIISSSHVPSPAEARWDSWFLSWHASLMNTREIYIFIELYTGHFHFPWVSGNFFKLHSALHKFFFVEFLLLLHGTWHVLVVTVLIYFPKAFIDLC